MRLTEKIKVRKVLVRTEKGWAKDSVALQFFFCTFKDRIDF